MEGHTEVLAVEGKRDLTLVHIEVDSQDAPFLERLAIFFTIGIAAMAQLAESVEAEAKVVVAKGVGDTEFLLG